MPIKARLIHMSLCVAVGMVMAFDSFLVPLVWVPCMAFSPLSQQELKRALDGLAIGQANEADSHGEIATWNVASIENFSNVFQGLSAFNRAIGNWNTARATQMIRMFDSASAFNHAIGKWNIARVTNMDHMFLKASAFNQALGDWNTARVSAISSMFFSASSFNHAIGKWNTAQINHLEKVFDHASAFNHAIGDWNIVHINDLAYSFSCASAFNHDLGNWNMARVTGLKAIFHSAFAFNQSIKNWNIAHVRSMRSMFYSAIAFNHAIGSWNTAGVTEMDFMLQNASVFNHAIGKWNTAGVKSIIGVFSTASSFNHDIGRWNIVRVTSIRSMFNSASAFNNTIGSWNIAYVADMARMFQRASTFNHAIAKWNTGSVTAMSSMFVGTSAFSQKMANWNTAGVTKDSRTFSSASVFNHAIGDWNMARVSEIEYIFSGAFAFNQAIGGWNIAGVKSMMHVFSSNRAFNQAIGDWNVLRVRKMSFMFFSAVAFNHVLGNWSVTSVAASSSMFFSACAFNHAVESWNLASATDFRGMFHRALSFDQPIGNWNTARMGSMELLFRSASAFNQAIGSWNTGRVKCMDNQFLDARAFRQDVSLFNTSNAHSMHRFMWRSYARLCPSDTFFHVNPTINKCVIWLALIGSLFFCCLKPLYMARSCSSSLALFFCQLRGESFLDKVAPWNEVDSTDSDPMARGRDLHTHVGAERWCITKKDLDLFEHEVRLAWKRGTIPNGDGEYFNSFHDDPLVGPTMYQVNDYLIKPLTAKYGGMSFALLLHPHGLPCNCFATHAWAEGVFEFCAKLRRGWPNQCNTMYVCFLSNPQNLDISALLDVPIQLSPFAQALSHASHMVVVPNRFSSIYSRLWCCFEAHLAYTLNKTITLPRGTILVKWVRRRILICLCVLLFSLFCGRAFRNNYCSSGSWQLLAGRLWHVNITLAITRTREFDDHFNEIIGIGTYTDTAYAQGWYGDMIGEEDSGIVHARGDGLIGEYLNIDVSLHGGVWDGVKSRMQLLWVEARQKYVALEENALLYVSAHDDYLCWQTTFGMAVAILGYDVLLGFAIFLSRFPPLVLHVTASAAIGLHLYLAFALYGLTSTFSHQTRVILLLLASFIVLMFFACFVFRSILRCRSEESRNEEVQQLNFQSLTEAQCSDARDRAKILEVLKDRACEVEASLQTLMRQGMSTRELRTRIFTKQSLGYSDSGLTLTGFLVWPVYFLFLRSFGVSFQISHYLHRAHVLTLACTLELNLILWQTWLNYDADLSNVVARAGIIAWVGALGCGALVGFWGIVGGNICAVCHVARCRSSVQQEEFEHFMTSLFPITLFMCCFLCWEFFATLIFGDSCVAIWYELIGIIASFLFCGVTMKFATPWPSCIQGTMIVGCSAVSCFLTAANLFLATKYKFFAANELPLHYHHYELLSLYNHYMLGVISLCGLGVFCPLWILLREIICLDGKASSASAEIEMQDLTEHW